MKKIFALFAALFVLSACNNEQMIDDLSGKYQLPAKYSLTSLESMSIETVAKPLRQVSLKLTGNGGTLAAEFITNDWFLKPGAYARGGDKLQNGTYLPDVTTFNSKPVLGGAINVATEDGVSYKISGLVQISDTETVNLDWTGTIEFPEDPPVVTFTWENSPYYITEDGTNYYPMEGAQLNKVTVWADDILGGYFEIVSASGIASLAGSYAVGDISLPAGALVNGYYVDLSAYGMGVMEGGSYLTSAKDYIAKGTLKITEDANGVSFSSTDFEIVDRASEWGSGTLPGKVAIDYKNGTKLTPPMTLTKFLGFGDNSAYGTASVTVKLGTDGITVTPGAYGDTYGGNGNYISIDFYSADGKLAAGTYAPQAGATIAAGEFAPGYDIPDWGMYNFGTCWWTVANDAATAVKISEGTITVAEVGGVYTINGTFGDLKVTYTGAIN